jgi:tyrosine-protein kinase Etk/Wzc
MQQTTDPSTIPPTPAAENVGIQDYFAVIARRRRLIAGITVVAAVVTAIVSLFLPNIYTARAKILPPQQQGGLLSAAMMQGALAAIGGDLIGESKTAKLYAEMLRIESLRDPIIDRFKLHDVYGKKYREDVYKAMDKKILIATVKEGIITISVDDKDPKRAADMANGLVSELKKLTTSMSMTVAGNNKGFFEERIAKSREELTRAENDLKSFQSRYKTVDASQQATLSVTAISQLTAQLNSQEIELSILRRTYADSSQKIKATQQSIGVLKDKIATLQNAGGSVALPGFEKIPERGQEYLHLMRRFKTAEAVYDMLVKQYEVSKLNAENDVSAIQVLQQAKVPDKWSKPKRGFIITMITFIAFLFSLCCAFVMEHCTTMPENRKAH